MLWVAAAMAMLPGDGVGVGGAAVCLQRLGGA